MISWYCGFHIGHVAWLFPWQSALQAIGDIFVLWYCDIGDIVALRGLSLGNQRGV